MHVTEMLVALSVKKQSAYDTPLADADIDKIVTFNTPEVTHHDAVQITDADKLGKGHDFATRLQLESFKTMRTFAWDADSLTLPWALAFILGQCSTATEEALIAWTHTFKFSDRFTVSGQNPVTSIAEIIGGWEARKIPSLAGASMRLSGELEKRLALEVNMQGSGLIQYPMDAPPSGDPELASYFINQHNQLTMADFGDTEVDVEADWHGWELAIDNNLQVDLSFFPGSGFQDPGVRASGVLHSSGVTPTDTDTVTIGSTVYTFKTTLTPAAYQVLINGSAAAAFVNLKKAINATGISGTDYGAGTLVHPTARATTITATDLTVEAITPGAAGNAIALAESAVTLNWVGAATFLADGVNIDRGSGAVSGRMEYGRRTVTLTLRLRVTVGSTAHAALIAGTPLSATITCVGDTIDASLLDPKTNYGFVLTFAKFQYKTLRVETVGDGILLFVLETELFYQTANQGPFLATVTTDVDGFLT